MSVLVPRIVSINAVFIISLRCDERTESNYSGLYSYHIPTNHWRKLRGPDDDRNVRSRFGHSMQFDHVGT